MKIEVSNGEIVDKLTIVEIKIANIRDERKLVNLRAEYDILNEAVGLIISRENPLYIELLEINKKLWGIEDRIRELEKNRDFKQEFIEVARSVYFTNDRRSEVKRKINELTDSALTEEKSYEDYSNG